MLPGVCEKENKKQIDKAINKVVFSWPFNTVNVCKYKQGLDTTFSSYNYLTRIKKPF
jgi:hypothetical protein